ncbi:lipid A biosynthesis acyltransferase [Guyparkeria sp. 1SP6A2]|nr:lipid A biosynthesis acyltransferase [Guyparkeria sp. 1SP6A2]
MNRMRDTAWIRIRGRLRAATAGLALGMLGKLSLRSAQRLGRWVGKLAWWTNGTSRRNIEDNLARCLPELPPAVRHELARDNLIETGKTLMEAGPAWRWPRERIEAAITAMAGFEQIEEAVKGGRGAILLAPHLGAWEIGGLAMALRLPTTALYRPPRDPEIEALIVASRSRFGMQLAPASLGGVRKLLAALKRGELVAILPDQSPRRGEGVMAPFFGHDALTMTLVRTLSRRSGAPAFTGWAERLPDSRGFCIHYAPVGEPIDHDDPVEAAAALNRVVETLVRQCPVQYQWSYQRFRRQHSGAERTRRKHTSDATET